MGFRKSILIMLMHCINNLQTKNCDIPLLRLSYTKQSGSTAVKVIDVNGNDICYTYNRFLEIFDTKGLDGFAF